MKSEEEIKERIKELNEKDIPEIIKLAKRKIFVGPILEDALLLKREIQMGELLWVLGEEKGEEPTQVEGEFNAEKE